MRAYYTEWFALIKISVKKCKKTVKKNKANIFNGSQIIFFDVDNIKKIIYNNIIIFYRKPENQKN